LRVARLRLLQHGASRAAVGRGTGDGARLRLDTTTALGRARRPGRPTTDHAVDGARLGVAVLGLRQRRARLAAVCDIDNNGTRLSLSATATRLSARRPRRPATDDAVDGAILSVARLRLRQGRARRSAERRLRRDTARLRLDTAAACLGTGRPGGPRAHSAVDGARLRVASLRLPQGRARQATVRRPGQHGPRLSLHTATAHLAA